MTTSRLKVIVVTPEAPDPAGGAPAQWYYVVLKGLAARGHHVVCLSGSTRPDQAARARAVFADGSVRLEVFPVRRAGLADKVDTFWRPYSYPVAGALERALVRELATGYDVLHLDQIWSGYAAPGARRALLSLHHLLRLDFRNTGIWPLGFYAQKTVQCRVERQLLSEFQHVRVESSSMWDEVQRLQPETELHLVPCALDPDWYPHQVPQNGEPTIGLIASMNWHLGLWSARRLVEQVFPRVKARMPAARLVVAGWGARHALRAFVGQPDVTILENVPSAQSWFRTLSALAYPLSQGSGIKVKVLESMAYGIPVVTTPHGIEGVKAEHGVHAFIAADDDSLADHAVALLRDAPLRARMSHAARRLVEEEHSVQPTALRLEAAYDRILQRGD